VAGTSLRAFARKALSATTLYFAPNLALSVDRLVGAFTSRPQSAGESHVLVAPPGAGNVGDFALVEAFIENVPGQIIVIAQSSTNFPLVTRFGDRVRIVAMPGLLYGNQLRHLADIAKLSKLLKKAVSLSVIGADVMDGAYNPVASVRRSNVASLARTLGLDSRVLGFSWNGKAVPAARKALIQAGRRGVRVFLRDPISHSRAEADGLGNITLAADIVFASTLPTPQEVTAILGEQGLKKSDYAVVNVSGLIANDLDQTAEFVHVVKHLRALGKKVVLLPHVSKPRVDDVVACQKVYDAVQNDDGVVMSRLLTPTEVRALASEAFIVVTGRMHLSVMSLMTGTTPVTLTTQGKVEGLMQMFGREDLTIEPTVGLGARVTSVIDALVPDLKNLRRDLLTRSAQVRQVAKKNFEGISL
jgi:colanic acid/amylovoran biosynthesis protein